jgi:threonine dehydrogenase-like Zn-dependent dehydrogenase
MRALVLEEFGRLAVQTLPDAVAGPGEVLVRVAVTGICGSDIHGYTGENGRRVPGQVMGHESAGRIVGFGPGPAPDGLEIGQPVTINPVFVPADDAQEYAGREQHHPRKRVLGVAPDIVATFAELVSVPARNVVALAEGSPLSHGALVEPLAVAVHAVRRVAVEPGDAVVVLGGGPIGQSCLLALRMAGVERIIVTEVDAARRALLERLGALAVDPREADVADVARDAWGDLADVAIDAVGVSVTLSDALRSTRSGGRVCLVGMGMPRLDLDAFRVSTEERTIVGSFTYSAPDFTDAAAWVAGHPDVVGELVSREVDLDEADAAFAGLARGDGTPGKVLVRVSGEEA